MAIYRTGNGKVWQDKTGGSPVGTFTDADSSNGLSSGDKIVIYGKTYDIINAVDVAITNPTIEINGTPFQVAPNSKMLLADCDETTGCTTDIAIYVDKDGNWYVNSTGGNGVDAVYALNGTNIYEKKELVDSGYSNFTAMAAAAVRPYSVDDDPEVGTTVDIIANTNIIPASRTNAYGTVNTFTKAMVGGLNGVAATNVATTFYSNLITSYYGSYDGAAQGGVAQTLFNNYTSSLPMIIMPAGDYTLEDASGKYLTTLDATFENYAPMLYGNNLKHNFMTVVGVLHTNGTYNATTIEGYGDGTGSSYGKLQLALWQDADTNTMYSSRMCGLAGVGDAAHSIDPWCFAASGPTAEMATASAAGAVASVKAAFSYMTNDQIYTLLALTADGPYLGATNNGTSVTTFSAKTLAEYLDNMYQLPLEYDTTSMLTAEKYDEYLDLFKTVFGYGLINTRRAIEPGFSVYYYDGTTNSIVSKQGNINRYWGNKSRASSVLSLAGRGAVRTSFYDIVENVDGTMSLPRVWNNTVAMDDNQYGYGLYMGDVLGDFDIDSTNKRTNKVGNLTINMAMSSRAYNDDMNGLDNMRVMWSNDKFDLATEYQHHLINGESRFSGRANGLLNLVSNSVSTDMAYKYGNFGFGGRAFVGAITDENLLDQDPVVASQFEPGKLGLANGGSFDARYNNDKFDLNMSFGVMHENNTVLGMYSDGMLALNGADTKYVDAVATYKPFENVKLSLRGTYAVTDAVADGISIANMTNIKSDAFAFGIDIGGFGFTAAMPLAVVDGKLGYGYADFEVVENNGQYEVAVNNAHTEYIDLSALKRELRFTTTYKQSLGEWTDAGVGFIYRVNPNNTDAFGNESIFMFKLHHRLGI